MAKALYTRIEPGDARDAAPLNAIFSAIQTQTTNVDDTNLEVEGLDSDAITSGAVEEHEAWMKIETAKNATLGNTVAALLVRQALAGEDQRGGTIATLNGRTPGHGGLHRITGTPSGHVRDHAQCWNLLDRLMGRTILTQTDGVMGVDKDGLLLHQRRHTQSIAGIFGEHQEGATEGDEAAVQGHAIHDG